MIILVIIVVIIALIVIIVTITIIVLILFWIPGAQAELLRQNPVAVGIMNLNLKAPKFRV